MGRRARVIDRFLARAGVARMTTREKLSLVAEFSARVQLARRPVFVLSDRYSALGIPRPHRKTVCLGHCEGTGYVPVRADTTSPVFRRLWRAAERKRKSEDGWHFVVCPACRGTGRRGR